MIKRFLSREKINIIGALTTSGQFISRTYDCTVKQVQIARFLRQLLDHVEGKLIVVWDGSRTHNLSNCVQEVLESRYGQRILECVKLPSYAPELNPMELGWRWMKSQGIGNRCPRNKKELKALWKPTRARFKKEIDISAMIYHALPS